MLRQQASPYTNGLRLLNIDFISIRTTIVTNAILLRKEHAQKHQ